MRKTSQTSSSFCSASKDNQLTWLLDWGFQQMVTFDEKSFGNQGCDRFWKSGFSVHLYPARKSRHLGETVGNLTLSLC